MLNTTGLFRRNLTAARPVPMTGIGRELVGKGIAYGQEQHPNHRIRISAQAYLERFYAGFGFESVSAPYDEDGILHVDMLR